MSASIVIRGVSFALPELIDLRPDPAHMFGVLTWPRQVVRVGVFFHGGDGPLRVDGEALNDEPMSAAVAQAVAMTALLWIPTTNLRALRNIVASVREAWRQAWGPDGPPPLIIEHTHCGLTGRSPRRVRNRRVTTEAQWRAMSKYERRRHLRFWKQTKKGTP